LGVRGGIQVAKTFAISDICLGPRLVCGGKGLFEYEIPAEKGGRPRYQSAVDGGTGGEASSCCVSPKHTPPDQNPELENKWFCESRRAPTVGTQSKGVYNWQKGKVIFMDQGTPKSRVVKRDGRA